VVYAASRSGVLVLATTNDSATSPRPLGTLPRPRTAYQASLDIAARLAAADPGNSSLEHERQLLALAGGRAKLLARTLESFAARWPEQVRAAHICAFVNGADKPSRSVIEQAGWIDRTLTYESEVMSIGIATSIVVGAVAGHGGVDLVLHLEDDWETRTIDSDALARAAAIMEDQTVGQVRLRHRSEQCLARHMITQKPIRWRQGEEHRRADAHFTFNPSLVRSAVVDRVFPARDERDAQRRFLMTGLDVIQLEPGVFAHIGSQNSRRLLIGRVGGHLVS